MASRSKSAQKVLDIERRFIDDFIMLIGDSPDQLGAGAEIVTLELQVEPRRVSPSSRAAREILPL